jgi:hypothetical protein
MVDFPWSMCAMMEKFRILSGGTTKIPSSFKVVSFDTADDDDDFAFPAAVAAVLPLLLLLLLSSF